MRLTEFNLLPTNEDVHMDGEPIDLNLKEKYPFDIEKAKDKLGKKDEENMYPDGTTFKGDVVDGKMQGKGKLTFPNGNIYEGEFVDGKMQGKGKFT